MSTLQRVSPAHRIRSAAVALFAVLAVESAIATVPPARDGEIAIREEFETARRIGSRAAYDQFIARHPSHPLAERARTERAKLRE